MMKKMDNLKVVKNSCFCQELYICSKDRGLSLQKDSTQNSLEFPPYLISSKTLIVWNFLMNPISWHKKLKIITTIHLNYKSKKSYRAKTVMSVVLKSKNSDVVWLDYLSTDHLLFNTRFIQIQNGFHPQLNQANTRKSIQRIRNNTSDETIPSLSSFIQQLRTTFDMSNCDDFFFVQTFSRPRYTAPFLHGKGKLWHWRLIRRL